MYRRCFIHRYNVENTHKKIKNNILCEFKNMMMNDQSNYPTITDATQINIDK